jgi:hypothetical protein
MRLGVILQDNRSGEAAICHGKWLVWSGYHGSLASSGGGPSSIVYRRRRCRCRPWVETLSPSFPPPQLWLRRAAISMHVYASGSAVVGGGLSERADRRHPRLRAT